MLPREVSDEAYSRALNSNRRVTVCPFAALAAPLKIRQRSPYQGSMDLTDFLAIWGAGLSTLVAIREVLASRDKLKVQLMHGVSDVAGSSAILFIANPGKRAVMVQYAGYAWPFENLSFRQKLSQFVKYRNHWRTIGWCHTPLSSEVAEGSPLPKLLEPGHSVQIWIPLSSLRKSARNEPGLVVAQVQDALGRNYYSQAAYFGPPGPVK